MFRKFQAVSFNGSEPLDEVTKLQDIEGMASGKMLGNAGRAISDLTMELVVAVPPEPEAPPVVLSDDEEVAMEVEEEPLPEQPAAEPLLQMCNRAALEDGDVKTAVAKFTEAMMLGGVSAMMVAKRAEMLLRLGFTGGPAPSLLWPAATYRAFRARAKARRFLGEYEASAADFAQAQKIDYDDGVADMHKQLRTPRRPQRLRPQRPTHRGPRQARHKYQDHHSDLMLLAASSLFVRMFSSEWHVRCQRQTPASCRRHPCQVRRCCRRMPLAPASHRVGSSCTWMCLAAVWTAVARRHRPRFPVRPIPRCRGLSARVNVDVVSENPVIWVIDGLCDGAKTRQLKQLLEAQDMDLLRKTDAYVDDMFDQRRAAREDAQLLVYMMYAGALQFVPRQYRSDPLRAFLWLAVRRKELLPEGAWDIALASVSRQAWCTQWDPEDLRRSGFTKSAARWRVPEAMLAELSPLVLDVLGAPVEGLPFAESRPFQDSDNLPKWILRDTTVVRYQQDESQVPHIDTSDVTMLVYLSSSGGNTCFPNLQRSIMPRAGRVLVFCSTTPGASRFGGFAGSAYGVPKDDTMHFGGLCPSRGEKLIVQLLFAALDPSLKIGSWDEALCGRALRQASYSSGVEAQPLPAVPSASRLPRLATSPQRCATGCKGPALDLEVAQRGEAKVCIHCWQRRLQALRGS
eukprot:s1202_g17.t2